MDGFVIKNKDGRYWNNRHRKFYKTILSASLYKSEKSAYKNYSISYEYGNALLKIGEEAFIHHVQVIED